MTIQIPLILTVAFFAAVFGIYDHKELGNMFCEYNMQVKDAEVFSTVKFSDEKGSANIYQLKKYGQEETLALANRIFEKVGTEVDESQNDAYQNTVIYHSIGGGYSIWVYYMGLSYDYTDFSQFEDETKPKLGCSRDEIEMALSSFDIEVPKQASFAEQENGWYELNVDCYQEGDFLIDGVIECQYSENECLTDINNNLKKYNKYKTCELISEKEAYEQMQAGDFYCFENLSGKHIQVEGVELAYLLDSKGYYQPVYSFAVKVEGESGSITIPALR